MPELRLPESAGLRFVFPHAPVRPVTLNGGMAMRAWYDIYSLDRSGPQDEAGIELIREYERLNKYTTLKWSMQIYTRLMHQLGLQR